MSQLGFPFGSPLSGVRAGGNAAAAVKIREFKRQIAAGIPFAVGSDVGPFPHGTQAVEMELMARYGMKPLAVLQADMIEDARLFGWEGQIGQLKPGFYADIVAVPGNPLEDISVVERVSFVMKGSLVCGSEARVSCQIVTTSSEYAARHASAVSRCSGSVMACAMSNRSNGSLWSRGSLATSAAWLFLTGSS